MKKISFLYLFLSSLLFSANDGVSTGNNMRKYFSNNFDSAISNPMTSETEFKTVDGSKSFSANLTCNDKINPFLNLSYTGVSDINISIKVDTNFDGNIDKSFSFSGISGVGTNGVIKCTANTWSNCKYYVWILENDNLSLLETNRLDLGGGYCINSSCGNLSSNQKTNVLDTLGGSVSSIYQNLNSKYLISKTNNDGTKIEFYGQNYKNCSNYQDSEPTGDMDTTQIVQEQSNDKNSVYYSLNKSVENQNNNDFDTDVNNTVTIKNNVSVEGDTSDYTFTYSGKTQNEDGSWSTRNDNAKVNIDFLNPDIKYCEIKYLEENTVVFSDGETHQSSVGETQTWKTKIVECTGENYDICPIDSAKGELIKHPCGEIDNFAEATSILMAVDKAADDLSCSLK